MNILGLNAYHGDSSAAVLKDGVLIAAAEEERFTRIKHWAGFPRQAIEYCLEEAGMGIEDIDYITLNRNTRANFYKKIIFTLKKRPDFGLIKSRLANMVKVRGIKDTFCKEFSIPENEIKARVYPVEHHRSHLASTFFVSEFDKAAVVSVDGFGDFTSVMVGIGETNRIITAYEINFPHSLGIFYSAFTQFLGFSKYGDEYKVMGLSAFGEPVYLDKMRTVVLLKPEGRFELDLKFFRHCREGDQMRWHNTEPTFGKLYSEELLKIFGSPREKDEEITDHYKNIAASVQAMYEEALFHILNYVHEQTRTDYLSLAGGCAMNSLANGKIFQKTPFKEIYIQPAAGDAGGAIGSAFYLWNHVLGNSRSFVMKESYLGPQYDDSDIDKLFKKYENNFGSDKYSIQKIDSWDELCKKTVRFISEGKVIGWFQGRMEWGPRALGNRSIICDPRREDMQDILNIKIKRREAFRPFAPSILLEATGEYFETDYPDPFMLKVYKIKSDKRKIIPAVTHIDGTGRLQTVKKEDNPIYWQLIKEFENLTTVPVVLNTSFNENEPIVNKPEEALDCFLRTQMDVLVVGNYFIERK